MSKDEKEICLYCKWWEPQVKIDMEQDELVEIEPDGASKGECRVESPAIGWAETYGSYWCGKFQNRPDDHESSFEHISEPANRVLSKLTGGEDAA